MNILKSKIFIVLCLIFLAFPFAINCLSSYDAPFESWAQPSNWTMFWGQYLSGFAAFVMLFVAWKTLQTTKEANRPYIALDIVRMEYSRVYVRCRNLGSVIATNVNINLDKSFIDKVKNTNVKEALDSINNTNPFVLEPNGEKIWEIFLIPDAQASLFQQGRGESAQYLFKGKYVLRKEMEENEQIFKANVLKCTVSYNEEYLEQCDIDYNNILDGISAGRRLSNDLFSVVMSMSEIRNKLEEINTTLNNSVQNKKGI